ncbi:MAG TPA: sterol desaturase family protein [Burkholderiales bacterium]|nr:sterol desaturase family protein [Burkholderiales bacterium]
MWESLIEYEALLRLASFACVFMALAAWETLAPRRALLMPKGKRWPANLGILILDTAIVRAIAPAAAVGIAVVAQERSIGLLHAVDWPQPLEFVLALLALDLAIYLQHVMFHAVPLLWRLHRVHHADLDIDVTTGTRFHPIEILVSLAIKAAVIFIIGAPVVAVLVFEIALNLTSMFNHSNVRIPTAVDGVLRYFLVTPDMHRVHHAIHRDETDRNFGFNLPWWDHLFGTYRGQPRSGHEQMTIGIPSFRLPDDCATLTGLLAMPFIAERSAPSRRRKDLSDSQTS